MIKTGFVLCRVLGVLPKLCCRVGYNAIQHNTQVCTKAYPTEHNPGLFNQPTNHDATCTRPPQIPVTRGRYHPSAIMFAPEGSIYVARSKQELVGAAASARKKIGTFAVDLPTLPPIVDRAFTL